MTKEELRRRIAVFVEQEARSCSMDPGAVTPLYIYRMWGGKVPLEEIETAMRQPSLLGKSALTPLPE